jgi:serine/threonine protein kinase
LDALSLKEACPHSIATGREQLSTLAPAASAEPALSGALAVGGGGGRDDAQSLGEEETGQVLGAVLGRVLAYLDIWSLTCKVHLVSKAWQRAVVECLVRRPDAVQDVGEEGEVCEGRGAVAAMSVPLPAMNLPALRRKFPWARFLAEGGFKKVYLVWNQEADRTEALSVMDMAAMRESGNEAVADSEVRLSFLLSRLVEHGACKHFVRVYQLLRCATAPPPDWGDQGNKQPMGSLSCFRKARVCTHAAESKACSRGRAAAAAKLQAQRGDFVYIRMELCDGGDLEEALREHPRPRARVVAQLVRQMALSLLSAQKELHMRHYDVKLLNFFLKSQPRCSPAAGARPADAATDGEDVGATDEFWERRDMEWVVKLADYGTAETDVASMGGALQERHVTTWENLLPAMLIWGDRALQGYDSDVHALGLCMLHLCTGDAPYEETVAALRCPRALADAWRSIWLKGCHSKTSKTASKHARDWKRRYASAAELLRTADDDEVLLQVAPLLLPVALLTVREGRRQPLTC